MLWDVVSWSINPCWLMLYTQVVSFSVGVSNDSKCRKQCSVGGCCSQRRQRNWFGALSSELIVETCDAHIL
jgi:(2Fe-2S) ferredoxin